MKTFGEIIPQVEYIDRPGAYAVILDSDGRIATVIDTGEIHLPGGGIDPGESELDALHREVFEEIGFEFDSAEKIGEAEQYCLSAYYQKYLKKICSFYFVSGVRTDLNPNPDHELTWMAPFEAIEKMAHKSHSWAVELMISGLPGIHK